MREQTKYVIAVVAAKVVGAAAITHQSLWVDEAAATLKVMADSKTGVEMYKFRV